ncbi:MAG: MFS transporter [Chloroflexi bacterium]|nr:MFS transporter [Chloroflexota bacterium]MDA1003969.1 MFS transporter [Chloroflexota bacterium]
MSTETPSPTDAAALRRNLRLLPWWWVVRWAWFGEAIWVIYLITERGLTLGEVFLFEAAFRAVVIAAEVPTGMIADRYGRRRSLVIGTTLTVITFFAFGTGSGLGLLLAAYTVLGLAQAFMSGADSSMLFDSLRPLGRDAEFAGRTGRLNAYTTAAIAAFTVVGAGAVHWVPLWAPIVISGLLSMPAIALAWAMTEPPRARSERSFLATGRAALAHVRHSPPLWSAMALMAIGETAIVTMAVTIQPVVVGYGVPVWALGLFVGAQMAMATLGSLLATTVKRWFGLPLTFAGSTLACALALLAGASGVPWLFPLFALPAIAFNVLMVHVIDYVARRAPEDQRATTISIGAMIASGGNVVASLAIGVLIDSVGLGAALTISAFMLAALTGGAFALWWRAGDHASEPAIMPADLLPPAP